jgi:AcrR family transcriptional regulator
MKRLGTRKEVVDDSSRSRLLEGAAKLFAKKGFDRVSIREIARVSDCNICLVSYYFGGKEKLYQSIFENFFTRVGRYIETSNAAQAALPSPMTQKDFTDYLRQQILFMVSEFESDPEVKVMLHREVMDGFPHTQKIFERHFATIKTGITQFYEQAQKAGHIRASVHVPTFAILLNRGIEAYFVSYLFAKPIRDMGIDPIKETERFIEQIEEIFLKGVLT